MSISTVSRGHH